MIKPRSKVWAKEKCRQLGLCKHSPLQKNESLAQKNKLSAHGTTKSRPLQKNNYYTYILECDDNILYTGIATDYKRRFAEHAKMDGSKKGAKFTKSHKPKRIVAVWETKTRSDASKLEIRIKQLEKKDKLILIDDNLYFKIFFKGLVDCRKFRRVV